MPQLMLPIICFFMALTIRAMFAFLETSITALRLFKLKELANATGRYESLFHALEKDPHKVLITILLVSSVADVTTAALATHIMGTIFAYYNFGSGLGFSMGIGIASIALVIFGEIIPKNLARGQGRGENLFTSMLWLIALVYNILYPIVTILINFSDRIVYLISGKRAFESDQWIASEKEVQFMIKYIHDKGLIEPEKTEMLQNIFEIGHTLIKEVMVPATDLVSIGLDMPIQDVLNIFSEYYFTRLPVYEGTPDNIIGMVHLKDVFGILLNREERSLRELVRPILFIPESVKVNQLLRELRQKHMHIAIVLNEHGSVTGLVTLEDVLEEIVGEISDEHEMVSDKILVLSEGSWSVDASVTLEEIENLLCIAMDSEESTTLGGFLTEKLQHLPKKGEEITYKDYVFQIQKANEKRVRQVLIYKPGMRIDDISDGVL
jgi:putative hemolysin